jgi:UPF0176 protein
VILNLAAYRFTAIDDPAALARELRADAERLALRGTVLVAPEGLNAFLAGAPAAVQEWIDARRADPRFTGLHAKLSESRANPFARLKVKVKREIIAFRREKTSPPDVGRAQAVAPEDLARWLAQGHDDDGRRVVLLDTRNREEVAHGSFEQALALPIDNFADFPEAVDAHREALRDATVVPFCTGGIRCEKAAHWMQQAGFAHVHQLDGGILGWFERVGGAHYSGRCFVFDARVALDPQLRPAVDD